MDLMVILTLWLYRLEHDEEPATEEELAMYNKLRNLFDDDSVDIYGAKLSSTVARLWGSMLDEVVVWGYVLFHVVVLSPLTIFQNYQAHGRSLQTSLSGPRRLRGCDVLPLWLRYAFNGR
jgi:hypothetical protein